MRFFISTSAAFSLLVSLAAAVALPAKREIWKSPFAGTINAPTENALVAPDTAFAFDYHPSAWCMSGYTPYRVYLTEGPAEPVFANVTETGALADGAFVYDFGRFVVPHFGLPQTGVAAPTELTLPSSVSGLTATEGHFLAVIEEFDGCPGHIAVEYSLASVPIALDFSQSSA